MAQSSSYRLTSCISKGIIKQLFPFPWVKIYYLHTIIIHHIINAHWTPGKVVGMENLFIWRVILESILHGLLGKRNSSIRKLGDVSSVVFQVSMNQKHAALGTCISLMLSSVLAGFSFYQAQIGLVICW